jgi:hypothetical protein
MFKINWKKWKADVDASAGDAERLTMLYSIRAHARGRTHRKRARITYAEARRILPGGSTLDMAGQTFVDHGGTMVLTLDLDAQTKYIGERWKDYERRPEPEAVAELLVHPARS